MELLLRAIEMTENSVQSHFAFSQFDLMEKIGQEVQVVRETEKNKEKFGRCLDDINELVEECTGEELSDRDFTITELFMHIYCLDPEPEGERTHPFIPYKMFQLPDDEKPEDLFGGPTCILHPEDAIVS
tara:strand:- start:28 stop:414 length:387 start_codon:yes stop_codon:yes gene_type:complete